MKIIILCGGIGSRMKNYSMPKPLNMIYGKPAIHYALRNLPNEVSELFFIYGIHLKKYNFEEIIINLFKTRKCTFYCIEYLTRGPVETAYIGTTHLQLQEDESIVFLDNDNIYTFPNTFFENKPTSFLGISVDTSGTNAYSFVHQKDGEIFDIVEKERISNMYCCGVYGFKNLNTFRSAAQNILTDESNFSKKNEIYMSDIYRYLIKDKSPIRAIEFTNQGNHIGSLKELEESLPTIPQPKMRICFDLDNTLVTYPTIPGDYSSVRPIEDTINMARKLHSQGHTIIIHTARRMGTHKNNVGAVIRDIGKVTFDILDKFEIPYDELIFGKPIADIYIDDRAINPYNNDFNYMGIFENIQYESIVNKLPNNKYNIIELRENKIIKTGPKKFMQGEFYMYSYISKFPEISHFFPECYKFSEKNNISTLELEYLKGIPLYYLFKNNLLHKSIILELIIILEQFHNYNIPININIESIANNYILKLEKRFSISEDYPFEDALDIQSTILSKLNEYTKSNRIRITGFIHGDFWFSNIIYTFDKKLKCFDMKGIVDGNLTTNGDPLYDYAKLYQSILGFDLVLYDCQELYDKYKKGLCKLFEEEVEKRGINIEDLRIITIGLISGTLHSIKSKIVKERIWKFIKQLLNLVSL
jgi:capsule biosynthesis phosphatase